ncbi:complement C1q tumor necrosis factor-related protein 6-like [Ruditapes philippinarum]|uniref:complement C1q tumor necrosis factor-related protein 6-like n=1 Tax=Ruditapes philippinarum TaxID=129788 RepID=UPI00295AD221|nr:complement C1q tumor necrosis factor-related protein 6-like [Ruditapes philippinarum]
MHLQLAGIFFVGITMVCSLQASQAGDDSLVSSQSLNNLIQQFNNRLNTLEARDKIQEQTILDLRKELSVYTGKVGMLQQEVSEKSELISILHKNNTRCTADECSGTEKLKTEVHRSRRQVSTSNVAFTAGLSRSILHAPAYQNIAFDRVHTNIGNGYNALSGIFTAPVSGTYVFFTSILVYNGREIFCRIVVNGVNIADTYGRGTDGRLDQGSQFVIVQLQKGHQVSVQNKVKDDAIFGNQDLYSTFSGFLLHSTYSG